MQRLTGVVNFSNGVNLSSLVLFSCFTIVPVAWSVRRIAPSCTNSNCPRSVVLNELAN